MTRPNGSDAAATDWEPAGPTEAALYAAVRAGDRTAYLRALAGDIVVLPISPEADAGLVEPAWATGVVDGRIHVIAFTSVYAMYSCVPGDPPPFRLATVTDLVEHWPDPDWRMAVNPGLPIGASVGPEELPAPDRVTTDAALVTAVRSANQDAFVAALIPAELLLPVRPDGAPSRDLTDPEFPWWTIPDADGGWNVAVFTGAQWQGLVLGDAEHIVVRTPHLAKAWPDPSWTLAVNPGTALAAAVPGEAVRELGSWLGDLGAAVVEKIEGNGPVQEEGTTLQMLIPPQYVSAYLEQGYGWAAGVVHAARTGETPAALYERLGLLGAGSPFAATDEAVAVLRWEPDPDAHDPDAHDPDAHDPAAHGAGPRTASVAVPDGATLLRLRHNGSDEPLAHYVDGRWVPADTRR